MAENNINAFDISAAYKHCIKRNCLYALVCRQRNRNEKNTLLHLLPK